MDEREKESQVEERSEVITEEGTERREEDEIDEGPAIGEAVAEEEERCEEDPECHSNRSKPASPGRLGTNLVCDGLRTPQAACD